MFKQATPSLRPRASRVADDPATPTPPSNLVSVVMPAHNSARFVRQSIESVQAQTYEQWELIVVDDASTDNTVAIVSTMAAEDSRIRLICSESNQGPAATRNRAITAAEGRYIAFLDSDDLWLPSKLHAQLRFMAETGAALSFTAYQRIAEDDSPISVVHVPPSVVYRELLGKNVIACLTVIYDRQALGKALMPQIRRGQDFGLWLLLLREGCSARGLDLVLGRYRVRTQSVSSNKLISSFSVWRVYRDVLRLKRPAAVCYFASYVGSSITRRVRERLRGS